MSKPNSKKVIGKILIVSYYFPPIKAISSFRNYCLAKYFQDHFDQVAVITTTNDFFLPKEKLVLPSVKVNRSPTLDYRTISHSEKASGVNDHGDKHHHFFRNLKNSFPFNLFLDLGGPFYILFGILLGLYRIRRSKITHILSSFHPYADHVIAYFLKRIHPSIYWIADFNNLHIEPDNHPLVWPALQHKVNQWIVSRADMVTTVSAGLVPHLQKFNEHVVVLENSIDAIPKIATKDRTVKDKFTISYTGSLYPKQSMDTLLEVLNHLIQTAVIDPEKIQLQYAGTSNVLWNNLVNMHDLKHLNKDLGVLPLKEAQTVMKNSQLNLLLTWTTSGLDGIIPAKFYDYIAIGQPILLIINGRKDPLWDNKFKALNGGFVSYEQEANRAELISFITKLYQNWEAQKPSGFKMKPKEVAKYFWQYQMPLFVEKLSKNNFSSYKRNWKKKKYLQKKEALLMTMNYKETK